VNIYAERGIAYQDYARGMHTQFRSPTTYRKGGPPVWLYDTKKLRMVLCEMIWAWICTSSTSGTCPPLLKNNLVELQRAADVQWARYDAMQPRRCKEANSLRRAVKESGGILPLLVKVLWLYRLGENSCAIAAETGLKPAAVRQRLLRMRRIADRLFSASPALQSVASANTINQDGSLKPLPPRALKPAPVPKPPRIRAPAKPSVPQVPRIDGKLAAALRATGMSWEQIGNELGHTKCGVFRAVQHAGLWEPKWKKKRAGFSEGESTQPGPSLITPCGAASEQDQCCAQ